MSLCKAPQQSESREERLSRIPPFPAQVFFLFALYTVSGFWIIAHRSVNSALGMGGANDPNNPMTQEIRQQVSQAISIGFGVYLSVIACLYFAGMSVKHILGAKTSAAPKS